MLFQFIISILGGVGLFLLGMRLMTEGLSQSAGNALRTVIAKGTRTPFRGLFSGFFLTSLVQSSSAVTVATIGFVNAGLLNLYQSMGIIFGSNIGTTTTAWIVALIGFHVNIKAMALPMIGAGMLLKLLFPQTRKGDVGEAIAGFGIFFLGIDILKSGFLGLESMIDITALSRQGILAHVLFLGVGFLLTVLMQSSSAAIALILTAVTGNLLPMATAASAVIGANVGTTSTALFAVLGATPNAKRLASAHIFFNLITGGAALIILPFILTAIAKLQVFMGLTKDIPTTLALFHTTFNLLGVALLWPFIGMMTSRLQSLFRTVDEDEGTPRYLDNRVINTPPLALDSVGMELNRLSEYVRRIVLRILEPEDTVKGSISLDKAVIDKLSTAIGTFVVQIQRQHIQPQIASSLSNCLRVSQYFLRVGELAFDIQIVSKQLDLKVGDELQEALKRYRAAAVMLVKSADPCRPGYKLENLHSLFQQFEDIYHELKDLTLKEGAAESIKIQQMSLLLEKNSLLRRMLEQMVKGTRYMTLVKEQSSNFCPG